MKQPVFGPMKPSERAFVATNWLRSYEASELHHVTRAGYWRHFSALVDGLLDSGRTIVARNPDDEDQTLGFVCRGEGPILHYVYVKWMFRDTRTDTTPLLMASKLIGESGLYPKNLRCSFTTVSWLKYAAKHGIQYEHDRSLVAVARAAARRAPREETHGT